MSWEEDFAKDREEPGKNAKDAPKGKQYPLPKLANVFGFGTTTKLRRDKSD